MNDKKPLVHPALTEFALQSAKDWEALAQERLGVIERLCVEVEALRGKLHSLREVIFDAHAAYERYGADCMLEGLPMIGAIVLEEIYEISQPAFKERQ